VVQRRYWRRRPNASWWQAGVANRGCQPGAAGLFTLEPGRDSAGSMVLECIDRQPPAFALVQLSRKALASSNVGAWPCVTTPGTLTTSMMDQNQRSSGGVLAEASS
jgi:hypothetical protein